MSELELQLQINEGNLNIYGLNTSRYLRFTESNLQGAFINYDGTSNVLNIGVNNVSSNDNSNDYNSISILRSNGNVGIGTINPGVWRLAVNGKIRAKEIKVETGWSDYVFYDDYKLPTLQEVEKHIKEKGHLKNIPSAEEVERNGIFLGEMNSKLLQKIEELTLYTIAQEKKLKSQNSMFEKQNKQLNSVNAILIEVQERLVKLEKNKSQIPNTI